MTVPRDVPLRVLVEPDPKPGAWNMAVDEVLLHSALTRGIASLRVYRWDEATVSLGYFQKLHSRAVPAKLAERPVVRRLSGGGAILHHHEWTYSCAVPPDHRLAAEPGRLYDAIHRQIIAVLAEFGVPGSLRGASVTYAEEPFLCFLRGDPRDIVCEGAKIVGSAQRRRKGAVLQHGSLLLRRSEFAAESPGVLDLKPELQLPEAFAEILAGAMAEPLGAPWYRTRLTGEERTDAARLADGKYSRIDWRESTERRGG